MNAPDLRGVGTALVVDDGVAELALYAPLGIGAVATAHRFRADEAALRALQGHVAEALDKLALQRGTP